MSEQRGGIARYIKAATKVEQNELTATLLSFSLRMRFSPTRAMSAHGNC